MVRTAEGQKETALHDKLSRSRFKTNLAVCNLGFKVG